MEEPKVILLIAERIPKYGLHNIVIGICNDRFLCDRFGLDYCSANLYDEVKEKLFVYGGVVYGK